MKPVAAGNAVATPVVKILMRNDAFDIGIIAIGCSIGQGQNKPVIENIQTLVFHRPHIEITDGDNHEYIKIIFAAKAFLVPLHGTLECVHGIGAAVFFSRLDKYFQFNLTSRHCNETVGYGFEVSGHQGKQITRLWMGVVPDGKMASGADLAGLNQIAVGKQHRRINLGAFNPDGIDTQHIWPVAKICDAAKTLSFTLGAIGVAGTIQTRQCKIGGGIAGGFNLQCEFFLRHRGNNQRSSIFAEFVRPEYLAIETNRNQLNFFAVQNKRGHVCFGIFIGLNRQC